MTRDLIGYGQNIPQIRWPNGGRLAVNFVINYEEGAELTPVDGDDRRERMSESIYETDPGDRELLQESVYEFGSRVGVWRIIDMLNHYGATATVFASAVALERNPTTAKAFKDENYDFVGHGYRWRQHYGMELDEERDVIESALSSIQSSTGVRPSGWFTRPLPSENTRKLLVEAGLLFDCDSLADDLPYYANVDGTRHLIVPYSLDINDIRFWKGSLNIGDDWFQYARDSFDALYAETKNKNIPRMMSVGLHCRVIGRAGRIGALERLLKHIRQFPDVWICNRTELAEYWARNA